MEYLSEVNLPSVCLIIMTLTILGENINLTKSYGHQNNIKEWICDDW